MSELSNNNVLSYPTMTRQRADKIQAKEIAYAEDVNAEFDHIVDVYNRLVSLLTGEWGDGTGRIYDLVDNAVSLANEALAKANDCVQKSGDTMTGHLSISLVPSSDYHVVNKKYVDDTIQAELSDPVNRISELENFRDNLNASQVKLENANFSSTNVNDGMTELFISVSNGKKTVADAITGKGVATSGDASFKQMADNINAILTFNEGTAGGTATAADIMQGKTAYARGSLIVGTYVPIDLSDATATSDKILEGYTAYVYGGKIIGTYIPPRDYPIYGTDTSNATATADDIVYGKTAYARGQLITGNLKNVEVEELYGINGDISVNSNLSKFEKDPITDDTIVSGNYTFSENFDFMVRIETISGKQYIGSYPMNDKGLYILQSSGIGGTVTTKKYRYTKSELGIADNESIETLKLAPGTSGTTLLYITTSQTVVEDDVTKYNNYLYIYTYHLRENGTIGREYESETNLINIKANIGQTTKFTTYYVFPKHKNSKEFYIGYYNDQGFGVRNGYLMLYKILTSGDYTRQSISMIHKYDDLSSHNYSVSFSARELSINDKYLYNKTYVYNDESPIIYINEENDKLYGISIGTSIFCYDYITDGFYTIVGSNESEKHIERKKVYLENGEIKYVTEKSILIDLSGVDERVADLTFNSRPILVTESYVLLCPTPSNNLSLYCVYFDVNINNVNDGGTIRAVSSDLLAGNYDNSTTFIIGNSLGNRIIKNNLVSMINLGIDYENIIGVKYKNKTFYAVGENTGLTAAVADVKSGKTFIGQNGIAETGTMGGVTND